MYLDTLNTFAAFYHFFKINEDIIAQQKKKCNLFMANLAVFICGEVTVHGSGTRIYCAFRENMIQVRGDFCEAKL